MCVCISFRGKCATPSRPLQGKSGGQELSRGLSRGLSNGCPAGKGNRGDTVARRGGRIPNLCFQFFSHGETGNPGLSVTHPVAIKTKGKARESRGCPVVVQCMYGTPFTRLVTHKEFNARVRACSAAAPFSY